MASSPITSWPIDGEAMETVTDFIFLGYNTTADSNYSHKIKTPAPWKKSYDKPRLCIKKQRQHLANRSPYSQSYGFFSSHVWTWELDHKVGWEPKNRCFRTVLEKTLESPLDCKEITPVNPKSNQPWIFIGRSVAAEAPIPWVTWFEDGFTGKDSDAGKDWGQEEKGATEDEMDGWHPWLNGHEFEQTLGYNERQGSLVCCNSWSCKELDTT